MPQTRSNLALEALSLLGQTGVGQAPAAEDVELASSRVPLVLAELRRRGLVSDFADDPVDDELFQPLARVLAASLAPHFGIVGSAALPFEALAQRAEGDIRAMGADDDTSAPVRAVYY